MAAPLARFLRRRLDIGPTLSGLQLGDKVLDCLLRLVARLLAGAAHRFELIKRGLVLVELGEIALLQVGTGGDYGSSFQARLVGDDLVDLTRNLGKRMLRRRLLAAQIAERRELSLRRGVDFARLEIEAEARVVDVGQREDARYRRFLGDNKCFAVARLDVERNAVASLRLGSRQHRRAQSASSLRVLAPR